MIWIGFTVMIATIVVSLALLRSWRGDALGIPLVAIGAFTLLYLVQPLQLARTDSIGLFFSDWQVTKALLVPAFMLACFMWGWLRPAQQKPWRVPSWNPHTLWNWGFGAACIGLILFVVFLERSGGIAASYSQPHGKAMAWETNTAYLIDGPWLMLSGSAMMILGDSLSRRRQWKTYVPYGFLALFLANAIMGGDRGPLFAVTTSTFVCYSIARYKQVKLGQAFVLLLLLGCVVAIVYANRDSIHLGAQAPEAQENPEEALGGLAGATSEYDREHGTGGQEFLCHVAEIDTVDQTGKLDWGVSWITFLVINPIPRLLWPGKSYPPGPGITNLDIRENTSFAPAGGSAPGIASDLYHRFHLLSGLFMFGLGYALRRLFMAARTLSSPVATVGYVMLYAFSLNMFAQGFGSIFVELPYSMVPVVLFAWVTQEKRRKARLRQRELILQHAAAISREQWSS
jgi:hypothetical protein